MKVNALILLISICVGVNSQVYNKDIIYEYKYVVEDNGLYKQGEVYLGCLGKEFITPSEQQYEVVWTTDRNYLKQRIKNTGIIEDSTRVWLHPPRMNVFSILEYSPFPQIKYPFQVGNRWNWSLTPGSMWVSDELGITEDVVLKYSFSINDIVREYISPIKSFSKCFLVDGKSTNGNEQSSFTGYYNPELGFVKMIFRNRNGSIITLTLNDVIGWYNLKNENPILFSY